MTNREESQVRERWRRAAELPPEVFEALRKPNRGINPVTIVATVDAMERPMLHPLAACGRLRPICCG